MLYEVRVLTHWQVTDNGNNEIGVALDYPTPHGWTDITSQPDANIPPTPNLFVAHGVITAEQLDALENDARYTVLLSEEVSDGEEA